MYEISILHGRVLKKNSKHLKKILKLSQQLTLLSAWITWFQDTISHWNTVSTGDIPQVKCSEHRMTLATRRQRLCHLNGRSGSTCEAEGNGSCAACCVLSFFTDNTSLMSSSSSLPCQRTWNVMKLTAVKQCNQRKKLVDQVPPVGLVSKIHSKIVQLLNEGLK